MNANFWPVSKNIPRTFRPCLQEKVVGPKRELPKTRLQGHDGSFRTSRNHLNQFPRLAGVGSDRVIWALTSETTFVSSIPANGGTANSTHVQMLRRVIESISRLLINIDKDGGYRLLRYCLRSTGPGGVDFTLISWKGGNSVVHKIACPFRSSVSVRNFIANLLDFLLPT